MLCNPLNRVIFCNKALDYFRFAVGPQNIDHPARSGIFPSHVSWSLLEHPSNMRLRRPGSSQLSCHNQTADSALALAAASMSGAAISLLEGLGGRRGASYSASFGGIAMTSGNGRGSNRLPELRAVIVTRDAEVKLAVRQGLKAGIEAGVALLEGKEILGHSRFTPCFQRLNRLACEAIRSVFSVDASPVNLPVGDKRIRFEA
jgi:hypothetical protein